MKVLHAQSQQLQHELQQLQQQLQHQDLLLIAQLQEPGDELDTVTLVECPNLVVRQDAELTQNALLGSGIPEGSLATCLRLTPLPPILSTLQVLSLMSAPVIYLSFLGDFMVLPLIDMQEE